MTSRTRHMLSAFYLIGCWPCTALAQDGAVPAEKLSSVFSEKNMSRLCNSDNRVRSAVLLGELGKVYQINLFALPDVPSAESAGGGNSYTQPVAQRAAYWIAKSSAISPQAAVKHGIGPEHEALTDLNLELIRFAYSLKPDEGTYRRPQGASFGDQSVLADRAKIVAVMLDPPNRPDAEATAAIACSAVPLYPKSPIANEGQPNDKDELGLVVAIRGGIDDLATPRNGRDDAFKKTVDAKVAYTMNGVKNEESVVANVTVGVGWAFDNNDALLGFARYMESSSETETPGDDDDSKDVRALSAGLLYRRPGEIGGHLFFQSAMTIYKTWDREQESELVRVRLIADDFSLVYGGGPIFCGRQSSWGVLNYSCKASLFAEKGRVLDAGHSLDFADLTDDDYGGIGGDLTFSFWLSGLKPVSQLMLTAQYKKMWVLSGDLESPARFMVELSYKVPNSDISLGLSRSYGENFDTFQQEEVNLLSVGFKY